MKGIYKVGEEGVCVVSGEGTILVALQRLSSYKVPVWKVVAFI